MSRTKPKPKIKTIPWDSAALLKSDKDIALYLEAVFEDGDPNLVTTALGDVARAKGMSQIASSTSDNCRRRQRCFALVLSAERIRSGRGAVAIGRSPHRARSGDR